jgi:hypothetical protein
VNLPIIDLVQRAVGRLCKSDANARLVVVFDQFEELIILRTERSPVVGAVKAFLRELQEAAIDGFSLLLSVRIDYRIFLEPLGVPPPHLGKNWQDVPSFVQVPADEYLVTVVSCLTQWAMISERSPLATR